jgi:DNA-binding NarL/FixJ family response regulator
VKKIRVLLVEDEDVIRASVRHVLQQAGFALCGEATTVREGLEAALRERPDICLVGDLADRDGVDLVRQLTREAPDTDIVMLSSSERVDDLIDAVRAGAVGYLLKGMDPMRLANALEGVVEGEAAIPRVLMTHLVKELQTHGRRRAVFARRGRVDLTGREWEVVEMLCDGLSTMEIAGRLSLSPVTVRRHVSEIMRKLEARDRAEVVALAEGMQQRER